MNSYIDKHIHTYIINTLTNNGIYPENTHNYDVLYQMMYDSYFSGYSTGYDDGYYHGLDFEL